MPYFFAAVGVSLLGFAVALVLPVWRVSRLAAVALALYLLVGYSSLVHKVLVDVANHVD